MSRRYRRPDDGNLRRMLMAVWCRIWCGHDKWSDGWAELFMYIILMLLIMFTFGFLAGTANGDLIFYAESVGQRVYAGNNVAVPLPYDLGYLTFTQTETHDGIETSGLAIMSVGPAWSGGLIGTGVALGAISIQVVDIIIQDSPRVIWDNFNRQIGYSEQAAMDGVLWGGGGPLPLWIAGDGDPDNSEHPVWIPFQWERFAIPGISNQIRGNGWVSISHVAQMVPVVDPVTGVEWLTGSGYTIDMFALAELDVQLRSGDTPPGWGNGNTAVPEPNIIVGILIILITIYYRRFAHKLHRNIP